MTERRFAAGEIIYRQGDPSDFAYVIKSGQVAVMTGTPGRPSRTVLEPGQIFGEIGIMTNQPRHRTARAISEVEAMALSRADFLGRLNAELGVVQPLLTKLFEHLLETEAMIRPDVAAQQEADAPPIPAIRLFPASPGLAKQLPSRGIGVERLPFRVGRKPEKGERPPRGGQELAIRDSKPFSISRRHFMIEAARRGLIVRDEGSHLGTIVNGAKIGGPLSNNTAVLKRGENEIIAGPVSSPFRFRVVVTTN